MNCANRRVAGGGRAGKDEDTSIGRQGDPWQEKHGDVRQGRRARQLHHAFIDGGGNKVGAKSSAVRDEAE